MTTVPFWRRLALSAIAVLAAGAAAAFPDRPITLVVPYPPGGASDVLGRIVARHLQAQLAGSTVVVDNRAGAGTAIGAQAAAQAAPDGHTLLISSNTTWTMNPALKPRLPYDPIKSFESIGTLGGIPLVLLVNPATPARSVAELVALARAQPGKISYASFGAGSSSHFAGEMFKSAAGVDLVHVPYKGSAPAMQDLIGNQVPVAFDTNVATQPQLAAGKVRALAVTSLRRQPGMPQVPTLAESGYPGFELTAWISVVAPRGLPEATRQRLVKAVADLMALPAAQADLAKAGLDVAYEPPAAYEARVLKELPLMRELVLKAGITVD
ncbi:MAG: tripartite tricarboxylate transporter substrate binding protein [Rubrivivax sp.]